MKFHPSYMAFLKNTNSETKNIGNSPSKPTNRWRKPVSVIILFLLIIHCKSEPQLNRESILTLSRFEGRIEINRSGAPLSVTQGTLVVSGDTVSTGPKSFVDLEFPGGALIRIKENSTVSIDQILHKGNLDVGLDLSRGKMHIKIKEKLKNKESFRIKTPTMVAGVRGTEFSISEAEDKVMVLEGTVSALSDESLEEVEVVGGNKALGVALEKAPLTEPEKKELLEDSNSLSGLEDSVREVALKNLKQMKEENAQLLSDQINSNKAYLEEQKNRDKDLLDDQKKRDRDALDARKAGDQEMLLDQKNKDSGNLSNQKDRDKGNLGDLKTGGAEELQNQKNKTGEGDALKKNAASEKDKILDSKKELESMKKNNLMDSVKPGK